MLNLRLRVAAISLFSLLGCGARSSLLTQEVERTGQNPTCAAIGDACQSAADCCDGLCNSGVCALPPPACANDTSPVLLYAGLTDPYSLAGDGTSLYIGQLEKDKPILRLPKVGGAVSTLVEHANFVDYLWVGGGALLYSDEGAVNRVSTSGGDASTLTTAFGPTGFAVTSSSIFLAEYLAKQLVQIDRATLTRTVLSTSQDGIYRVAVDGDVVYFSSFLDGLRRYHPATQTVEVIGPELGVPRAVTSEHGKTFFTVPSSQSVYRLDGSSSAPVLIGNLAPLGLFPEALVASGDWVYLTLSTGNGAGLIVRVPKVGAPTEVVSSGVGPSPSALVVDEDCVYWTERTTGSVYRAHKPPP